VLLGSDALRFGTWDAALSFLGEQARTAPLTIILDEFQWLKHAQPALDSIIQRHWDRWDREALPVTLVLAGSALTLMEQLLERGAPLFGRATARPRLEPLDYRDAAGFAADQDPEALLRRWAVLGGTPQYQVWAGDGPLEDIITSRILAKDAALYDEPRHLLREGEGIRDPAPTCPSCGRSRTAPPSTTRSPSRPRRHRPASRPSSPGLKTSATSSAATR
jgi:AAA+ ATPase superfamily predicted ATPase